MPAGRKTWRRFGIQLETYSGADRGRVLVIAMTNAKLRLIGDACAADVEQILSAADRF